MTQIHMTLAGLDNLQRGLAQAPVMTQREMLMAITEATLLVEREVKDAMPKATGITAGSIASDAFTTPVGAIGVVGSAQPSAAFVELGTKPHPVSKAGRVALENWVRMKLGVSAKEAPRVAYLVARKIARKGTKAQRPFEKAVVSTQDQVIRMFEAAAARVAAHLASSTGDAA